MTKRKRDKPDDQRTISAFFGASLAVTSPRVAEEERPEKSLRGAAVDGPSGEQGAPAPSDTEAETGTQPASNNAAAPVTVKREAFMKKMAKRQKNFLRYRDKLTFFEIFVLD